ncbi:MAG TPA: hypothetical protein VK923_17955 [Euzebyales bacterium]|nr:hypothetical protein [Euzebyales bacterium]
MGVRLRRSLPTVFSAGNDLVTALNDLVTATGRWLALQPVAQELPVYAGRARQASSETLEHAGGWAGATATRAREATSSAASTARTQTINLVLVALLLWWVDRMLTSSDEA